MLLLLEHTFLLLSHPSFTTKVFPVSLRFHRHSAAANPVGEDVSGVLVTPSGLALNGHLLERFISMLELDPTLIKSHPNYDSLLQYGSLDP